MPIVLVSSEPREIEVVPGVRIRFQQPPGDQALRVLRRHQRSLGAAEITEESIDACSVEALVEMSARFVLDWSGIGTEDGSAVAWPEPGRVGFGPSGPSAEGLAARMDLLRRAPHGLLSRLDTEMARPVREAVASGKDSATG